MKENLQIERADTICTITLDAPEKRNAMSPKLTGAFQEAISEVSQDATIRVLIIAAKGPAFSAGGDIDTLEAQLNWLPEENRRFMSNFYRSWLSILDLDIPTIAAIGGHAIGAGLSFVLGCDMRVVAIDAKLGFTYLNLGLHPGMGTTHLLPLLVGTAFAAELLFTGRLITGREAMQIGLVNRAVPGENVYAEALELAKEIALKSPSAVRMTKRALAQFKLRGLDAALDLEASAQMTSFASMEMREAIRNLRERNRSH